MSNAPLQGTLSIFDSLGAETVNALSRQPVTRLLFEGQKFLEEGEPGDELYVVYAGKLDVEIAGRLVGSYDVERKPLCFGELGLIGLQKVRSATVTARSILLARVLYRQSMLQVLQVHDETLGMQEVVSVMKQRSVAASGGERSSKLAEIDMFKNAGCSKDFLDFLAGHLEGVVLLGGQNVVDENRDDKSMYFLTHGTVKVVKDGVEVARMQSGAVFGEMVIFGLVEKRSATVVALETCYAEKLHQSVIIRGLELFPTDRDKVLALVRDEMHKMNKHETKDGASDKASDEDSFVNMFRLGSNTSEAVDENFLRQLFQQAMDRLFMPGELITEEGRPGHSMFALVSGTAGVYVHVEQRSGGHGGTKPELQKKATIKHGSLFGELAMLGVVQTRSATIKAESLCHLWEISKFRVERVMAEFPDASRVFVPAILKSLESSCAHRLLSMHLFKHFDR